MTLLLLSATKLFQNSLSRVILKLQLGGESRVLQSDDQQYIPWKINEISNLAPDLVRKTPGRN